MSSVASGDVSSLVSGDASSLVSGDASSLASGDVSWTTSWTQKWGLAIINPHFRVQDASEDMSPDASEDASPDMGEDVSPDAGEDTSPDAGEDASPDMGGFTPENWFIIKILENNYYPLIKLLKLDKFTEFSADLRSEPRRGEESDDVHQLLMYFQCVYAEIKTLIN
jgi:hypothetical protein